MGMTSARGVSRIRIRYVRGDGEPEVFDIGDILDKYGAVFIGRLPEHLLEIRRGHSPYELFIFTPNGEVLVPMNAQRSTVSRSHVKLIYDDSLRICDHGHDGRGSTNGTYVFGNKVPPGRCVEISDMIKPVYVSLGSYFEFQIYTEGLVMPLYDGYIAQADKVTIDILRRDRVPYRIIKLRDADTEIDYVIVETVPEGLRGKKHDTSEGIRYRYAHPDIGNVKSSLYKFRDILDKFLNTPSVEVAVAIKIIIEKEWFKNTVLSEFCGQNRDCEEQLELAKRSIRAYINGYVEEDTARRWVRHLRTIVGGLLESLDVE